MRPDTHPEAGDLRTATVEHLLDLANDGDHAAAAELDRRGVEPDMLEPDDDVVAVTALDRRNEALLALAAHAGGRTVVGVEIRPAGVGRIVLSGGLTLLLEPDGGLALLDEHESTEVSA